MSLLKGYFRKQKERLGMTDCTQPSLEFQQLRRRVEIGIEKGPTPPLEIGT